MKWFLFEEKFREPYKEFARREFGQQSYQGFDSYLNWLYAENPTSKGASKEFFLAADQNEKIVGCIHKMRLPWQIDGNLVQVPALHNLMVSPEYRNGAGFFLLKTSFRGEEHALIPGVTEPLASAYTASGCQQLTTSWYRELLRPISGALYLGASKLFGTSVTPRYFKATEETHSGQNGAYSFETSPSEEVTEQISKALNASTQNAASPLWDKKLVQWRFFHPIGPKHLAIYRQSQQDIDGLVIMSLGPRNGLNVARVIAMTASSKETAKDLLQLGKRAARKAGAHLLLTYSADRHLQDLLGALGMQAIEHPALTFLYHRDKSAPQPQCSFTGAAGDFGFEAIEDHASTYQTTANNTAVVNR